MADMLPPIRRVVTGDDANGKSRVIEDAPATLIKTVAGRRRPRGSPSC